jgi:peptidoglycan/xylan/chitin deacetylase (PgdA/CDA1 family)
VIELAITIDDPHLGESPFLSAEARDEKIRASLRHCNRLQAALFVCGERIDSTSGGMLLKAWGSENHLLGNHTYSHWNLNSKEVVVSEYIKDVERCHELISYYKGFTPFFRYPYLKGGDTTEKRDAVRYFLNESRYRQGYVSVDASDWCIDARLTKALRRDENTDLRPYRDYYLSHIKEHVIYYDTLANDVLERSIKHTLLIHHNLLNALFLGDLLNHLQSTGCKLINASEAYQDSVYLSEPGVIPFGESIVWALAKERGSFESQLRYPAEDERYEREPREEAGL